MMKILATFVLAYIVVSLACRIRYRHCGGLEDEAMWRVLSSAVRLALISPLCGRVMGWW